MPRACGRDRTCAVAAETFAFPVAIARFSRWQPGFGAERCEQAIRVEVEHVFAVGVGGLGEGAFEEPHGGQGIHFDGRFRGNSHDRRRFCGVEDKNWERREERRSEKFACEHR